MKVEFRMQLKILHITGRVLTVDESLWEAYHNAKSTVAAFERMFELERENVKLKAKVKEHEDRIHNQFQSNMKEMGDTLSLLVNKAK